MSTTPLYVNYKRLLKILGMEFALESAAIMQLFLINLAMCLDYIINWYGLHYTWTHRSNANGGGRREKINHLCCESHLLQAPCKLCRLNTMNDFFSSAHKGKFCRAKFFWGWMILIWHSHSRSDFWHEWHSFVIYLAQGWSCAWPSSCYELTTRDGFWWSECWLIHQKNSKAPWEGLCKL